MKVLFITKVKAFAGSEKHLVDLIPELQKKGMQAHLVIVVEKKHDNSLIHFYNQLDSKLISWSKISIEKTLSINLINQLKDLYKKHQPDIIHAHLIHAELWSSLLRLFLLKKIKIVSTIHGFDEQYLSSHGVNFSYKLILSPYYWICFFNSFFIKNYIFVSKGLQKLYINSGLAKFKNSNVIYHGLNLPSIEFNSNASTKIHKILIPGRIVPYKGQEFIIDALPAIISKIKNVHFVFAGDVQGDYGTKLKAKAQTDQTIEHVSFIGHSSNIAQLLFECSLIVVPSKVEGFGLVLLEGFNAKKFVIGFDVPAINEIIENGENGFLIPPFNTNILAQQIIDFINNEKYTELNKIGFDLLQSKFSLEKMVDHTYAYLLQT